MTTLPRAVRAQRIAAAHLGVITAGDLRGLGFSRAAVNRQVQNGWLTPLHPGVFGAAGHPRTWWQLAMAASRWGGAAYAISHRSAAVIWEVDGITRDRIELVTTRSLRSDHVIVRRVRSLPDDDVRLIKGIRVTSPARTVHDIAACVPSSILERSLDDLIRRKLVRVDDLLRRLKRDGNGRKGSGVLRNLLDARDPGVDASESRLERRLIRLIAGSDLPQPRVQFEVRASGRVLARLDLAYPEARLAVEADGYRYHHGRAVWANDLARRTQLATLGWRVIHVTWEDVTQRPELVIAAIRHALLDDG